MIRSNLGPDPDPFRNLVSILILYDNHKLTVLRGFRFLVVVVVVVGYNNHSKIATFPPFVASWLRWCVGAQWFWGVVVGGSVVVLGHIQSRFVWGFTVGAKYEPRGAKKELVLFWPVTPTRRFFFGP